MQQNYINKAPKAKKRISTAAWSYYQSGSVHSEVLLATW